MTPPARFPAAVEDTGRDAANDTGNGGGGRYDRLEERIRILEGDVREIKTRMESVATKSDVDVAIAKLKTWAMGGSLVGTIAVIGWLVYALVRASQ